ncbi:MAG TPA: hypothetical protein VF177_23255 [Anaerolineae bacterium]
MEQAVSVLLVEDDPSMLDGMKDLLEMADTGYNVRVLTAGNGEEALEILAGQAPDLKGYQIRCATNPHLETAVPLPLLCLFRRHMSHKGDS